MVTSVRRLLLVLTFLSGLLAGMYLTAVVREGHAQSAEVAAALNHAADTYGVSRTCLWNIAFRESRYQPWQDNWQSSGAAGLMQFKAGTYRFMAAVAGYPSDPSYRYNSWWAAHVAAWAIANPGLSQGGLRHWGGWC